MTSGIHRFNVGSINCTVIHEGGAAAPVDDLPGYFKNASAEDVQAALAAIGHTDSQIGASMNCLYIESGDARLLVDTGLGQTERPGYGRLHDGLNAAGIAPADINLICITHFHGDHIGGLTDGEGAPVFPNARYVTTETEWGHWLSEETLAKIGEDMANFIRGKLLPLEDQFSYADDGDEIAPGVCIVDMPGHTPGHSGLLLESDGERLLHVVDLLHRAPQFARPDFHHVYDTDAELAVSTRRAVLARAADENLLTMFYHLPFPGLGRVRREGDGFRWQPI